MAHPATRVATGLDARHVVPLRKMGASWLRLFRNRSQAGGHAQAPYHCIARFAANWIPVDLRRLSMMQLRRHPEVDILITKGGVST